MRQAGARALRDDEQAIAAERELRVVEDLAERRPTGRFERAGGERRTITITGQAAPPRRRPSPAKQQLAARPDRVALWAFLLGLFLVLVAAATAYAGV